MQRIHWHDKLVSARRKSSKARCQRSVDSFFSSKVGLCQLQSAYATWNPRRHFDLAAPSSFLLPPSSSVSGDRSDQTDLVDNSGSAFNQLKLLSKLGSCFILSIECFCELDGGFRRLIEVSCANFYEMGLDVAAMVHGQVEFTLDLYKAVVKGKESENVALSPLSISLALAMTAAGTKGPTREQIAKCIKLPEGEPMHAFSSQLKSVVLADGSGAGGPQLALANRVWVEQTIKLKPEFQKVLKDSYGSEAASVDFLTKANEALKQVNEWAKDETHGKIEDLLPPGSVDEGTRVVLANALYFKGAWKKPFDEEITKDGEFFLLDGKTIQVPMMHTTKKQFVKDFSTFKALRLPYSAGNDKRLFSMFILLPHEKQGIADLEKALDFKTLSEDLKHISQEVPVTQFALPKFKISCGFEVPEALQSLGLALPFGEDADLTEMVDSPLADKLYVSNMYHKTFVEVNEKGTEAAAATAATVTLRGLPMFQNPIDFVCDHPFLFVIKEELTNVIIFTGRITDPSVEK